ncbi:DUF6314 family protein [Roseicyclus mahoneyensis]|uniref:DUF6314 domain-containing protein n=1 Tax=Roseicyclus mahoneyensis TaxID=164332 RepID=A0A316H5B6_9RHOB|nr:DUF6314 family protein [Roseicyclus mahoneyensis]PWK62773.1 hypothetical protein C7455_101809 [Roseicyclus mahoneyensis]
MIGLADLQGLWRLTRTIEDARAGLVGHLLGTSRWHPDDAGLVQDEKGVLHYGTAPPMQAARRYLWRAEAGGLAVFFADGRPFHLLSPARLTDRHWCDPDTYVVSYDLSCWPDWTQVWHVSGPRKDAVITSRFQPLG